MLYTVNKQYYWKKGGKCSSNKFMTERNTLITKKKLRGITSH